MKKLPTIIQLSDYTGEHSGLYFTERTDTDKFQDVFDLAFQEGLELEEEDEDWDIRTYVDDKLEHTHGIIRIYAENVSTNVL